MKYMLVKKNFFEGTLNHSNTRSSDSENFEYFKNSLFCSILYSTHKRFPTIFLTAYNKNELEVCAGAQNENISFLRAMRKDIFNVLKATILYISSFHVLNHFRNNTAQCVDLNHFGAFFFKLKLQRELMPLSQLFLKN